MHPYPISHVHSSVQFKFWSQGQGKQMARISANVNRLSAFRCLMALHGSPKITLRGSRKQNIAET
jgi:hypothetical protein